MSKILPINTPRNKNVNHDPIMRSRRKKKKGSRKRRRKHFKQKKIQEVIKSKRFEKAATKGKN